MVRLRDDHRPDALRLHRSPGHRFTVPVHEGRLGPVGQATRRLGLGPVDRPRRLCASGLARCRPREPRQEHRGDGHGVEHRLDLVHVHPELRLAAGGARHGRCRRGRLRCGGRRTDCDPLPRPDAQRSARQLHGSRFRGLGAGRRARRHHRGALGVAGGVRRGRHSRPGAESALHQGTRLPHGRRRYAIPGFHALSWRRHPCGLRDREAVTNADVGGLWERRATHRPVVDVGLAAKLPESRAWGRACTGRDSCRACRAVRCARQRGLGRCM
ncbi:hypothetical protein D3C71_1343190 [compost metagenome]